MFIENRRQKLHNVIWIYKLLNRPFGPSQIVFIILINKHWYDIGLRTSSPTAYKKHILTSLWSAQHPNAVQNIQHLNLGIKDTSLTQL